MLQLCVICVLHTNVIIVANMSFVLHILLLSSSVPRPQDVCTVTTFFTFFAFFVCPYTQLTSTAYFFFDFNFFFGLVSFTDPDDTNKETTRTSLFSLLNIDTKS